MCIICKNGVLASGDTEEYKNMDNLLVVLDISECTSLTSIPHIVGVKQLICNGCTSLLYIPNIEGLEELDCYDCTNISHLLFLKLLINEYK